MADFKIERSDKDFAYWRARPFIGEDLRRQLSQASVLVVPQEGFRDSAEPLFPAGTEELLGHLRDAIPAEIGVDICIEDDEYRELALHSDLLILAGVVVTNVACGLVASAIYDYVKDRLGSRAKDTNVRFQMIIEHDSDKGRKAAKISYEGPVAGFQDTLERAISGAQESVVGADLATGHRLPGRHEERE